MCKKMLQSLLGGGQNQMPDPASSNPAAQKSSANVLGQISDTAAGGTVDTSSPKLSGGVDPNRRKKGVPGLGL